MKNNFLLTDFLLDYVKTRPGMYLMDKDLKSLQKFIIGYRISMQLNTTFTIDTFLENFSDWFINIKNLRAGTMWYPIILEECNNSEEKALSQFWKYLEDFKIDMEKGN